MISFLSRQRSVDQRWHELVGAHRQNLVIDDGGGHRTIHYIDIPSAGGDAARNDAVVLVHGFADSTYSWHANVAVLLAAGLRVVVIDLPGLGRSSIPGPGYHFGIENQSAAVLEVIEALDLQRALLVGHSMGGAIVLYLCLHHRERFERAVAIAPVTRKPRKPFILTRPGAVTAARLLGSHAFYHALRDIYADASRVSSTLVDEYARPAARPGYWQALRRLSTEFFSPAFVDMSERLAEIDAALLLLWGDQDSWVRPRPAAAEQIPNARFERIADAGHNVHQERPEATNAELLAALRPG